MRQKKEKRRGKGNPQKEKQKLRALFALSFFRLFARRRAFAYYFVRFGYYIPSMRPFAVRLILHNKMNLRKIFTVFALVDDEPSFAALYHIYPSLLYSNNLCSCFCLKKHLKYYSAFLEKIYRKSKKNIRRKREARRHLIKVLSRTVLHKTKSFLYVADKEKPPR